MRPVIPAKAIVRPRVLSPDGLGPRLLEQVVEELASDAPGRLIWIMGGPGSGKTTALAHLSACLPDAERFIFLDDASQPDIQQAPPAKAVVATRSVGTSRNAVQLRLQPWGPDDLAEYLLAVWPERCRSVMQRIVAAGSPSWAPELARVILDQLAQDPSVPDAEGAIVAALEGELREKRQRAAVAKDCFSRFVDPQGKDALAVSASLSKQLPQRIFDLLRHEEVGLPLACEHVASALDKGRCSRQLSKRLPEKLVSEVGACCRGNAERRERLVAVFERRTKSEAASMAASILLVAEPNWRPGSARKRRLRRGYFRSARWSGLDLAGACLSGAVLSGADLSGAQLSDVDAVGAGFDGANLRKAVLLRVAAAGASFEGSNLELAKLTSANLSAADLSRCDLSHAALAQAILREADLTEARLCYADFKFAMMDQVVLGETDLSHAEFLGASLRGVDFRTATLHAAGFSHACLCRANLEDVAARRLVFKNADLQQACLTGSRFPGADFSGANLCGAHLAEIDWEGADLRGSDLRTASFHMGSSRSGLVGSPIALEGSMTGFYTDAREERYFKKPEEIRKANLCEADLRGANLTDVDFYLVDLRGARLDPARERHVRRSGAILEG